MQTKAGAARLFVSGVAAKATRPRACRSVTERSAEGRRTGETDSGADGQSPGTAAGRTGSARSRIQVSIKSPAKRLFMEEEAQRNDCPLPKGRGKDVKLVPTSRPGRAPSPQRDPEARRPRAGELGAERGRAEGRRAAHRPARVVAKAIRPRACRSVTRRSAEAVNGLQREI